VGPSLSVLSAQAKPGLQQLFFCGLIPSKGLLLPIAVQGNMRAFRLCRVGALSAKGTALPGGAVQISTCLPQGAPLPYRPLRDRNSLSNAAAEWPHAFVALPLPLCPKLMGVLGEEWQVTLMEGMLGGAGRGTVLPGTSPQKAAVSWECGKRQRAKEHWLLLFYNSS